MPRLSRDDLYSFQALWRQYRLCRRNKRRTRNALAFEVDAEAKLLELSEELKAHRYRPGTSICFITDGTKPREVFAADFRDRVVHHLLVSHYQPVFERRFIHGSYACRKGKGTLAASDALMRMLRQVTANGRRQAFALRLDVASFFPSIDKRVLYRILRRAVRDPELRWLTRVVLFHDPTADYRFNNVRPPRPGAYRIAAHARTPRPAPGSERYPVPARKSLFGKHNRRGLPIGNLTSQFWANVYLNELDHFVKRTLGCRHYLRYVDDLCLLADDPARLACWRNDIERFLRERLHLALRADCAPPGPVSRGVDWVGWRTWWDHRLPRRQTLANLRLRLAAWERDNVKRREATARRPATAEIDLAAARECGAIDALRSTLASYAGHLRRGSAWRAWQREWARRPWLGKLLEERRWVVRARWPQRRVAAARTFARQLRALTDRAGEATLVFVRVGRYVELRGAQRLLAERILGIRAACSPRGGFALVAGVRCSLAAVFRARALRRGIAVVDVREVPPVLGVMAKARVVARQPWRLCVPSETAAGGMTGRRRCATRRAMLDAVTAVLEDDARVAYALVFGSAARGALRAGSDLDLAIATAHGTTLSTSDLGGLASRLEAASGRQVGVVLLDEAPVGLAYRIFRDGRILFLRDRNAFVERKARAIVEYLDFRPIEERCARGVLAAASRG